MRPLRQTPAHVSDQFAELVCSNSLGSTRLDRALGLLKEEMRRLGSLVIACADAHALPAGGALAVDREGFSGAVTQAIHAHPRIEVRRQEVETIPAGMTILATGPLTASALAAQIGQFAGQAQLYFYDALAPIVTMESIAMPPAWRQSRYDRDSGQSEGDYINCPLDRDQYEAFVGAVRQAQRIELRSFETDPEAERFFEGCLPIEVLAGRSMEALAFGPMRPVGLRDPRTGRRPYAVVQLRQDDQAGALYNIVGFQTNIKWPEQRRVLQLIPGLEQAEFVRLGQMHRNTFVNSPLVLHATLQTRSRSELFFAGQITGTEGYAGSAAGGLWAGLNAARLAQGLAPLILPNTTMMGALFAYITQTDHRYFQPMKSNFGLMPELETNVRNKGDRYLAYAERALHALARFMGEHGVAPVDVAAPAV
jgi:methylenetetrahydrofolate--tRNA-(uracil-5-)-methyltransferase